jgi:hypothetical protein
MIDSVRVGTTFLRSLNVPGVTGDLNTRQIGQTTVYLEHDGGARVLRHVLDRMDLFYAVYSLDREEASQLALDVVEHFLEQLPNSTVAGAYVLDTAAELPQYDPDDSSREHRFIGSIAMWLTKA